MTNALVAMLADHLDNGIASAIRITTTFNRDATVHQMLEAGDELGLNQRTVKNWFYTTRREDFEMDWEQAHFENNRMN